ncbi:2461_t:CDS:2, partial [Cetraspora pellucida]
MHSIDLSIYEVYAFEEKEKEDVNNLQKEFKKKINAYVNSDINTNADNTFVDWDLAIEHIEKHSIENGFEVVKYRLQKNKRNEVVHHTFECKNSEMLEEIKFLTNIGCGMGLIICELQECFPDATNAAITYEKLMQLQYEEHGWFIDA